jgi:hypothetical protein
MLSRAFTDPVSDSDSCASARRINPDQVMGRRMETAGVWHAYKMPSSPGTVARVPPRHYTTNGMVVVARINASGGGRIRDHGVNPRTRRGPLPFQDCEAESRDHIPISATDALLSLLRDFVILGF